MTDVFKPFVAVMPLLMPRAWRRNKTVANTLLYDLTLISDRSALRERRTSIRVPTLVIGGDRQRLLAGQSHMVSAKALTPVLQQFFRSPDGGDAR